MVVVNHHLFFADLAVRESGMAELLPTVRVAVFDEAHQLNETGVQFLGRQLGTGQLLDFTRDLLAAGLQLARGLQDWQQLAGALERATRELRLVVGRASASARLRWSGSAPEGVSETDWQSALADVQSACEDAIDALATVSEIAPDFSRLQERASTLADRAARFLAEAEAGSVRWVDVGQQLRLVESPLDIAHAVRGKMLKVDPGAEPGDERQPDDGAPRRAWIFTSATLGDDERLSWFTEPCGLQDAQVLRVGSPFDYPSQAAIYLPRELPRPTDPGHGGAVAQLAAGAAQRLGGRTMVLTTTLRALRGIGEQLQQRFRDRGRSRCWCRGNGPSAG